MDFNRRRAQTLADELTDTYEEQEAREFAETHREKPWYSKFTLILNMLTDRAFRMKKSSYVKLAGVIAYFVFPMDAIPDVLPGVGFIDDLWVMTVAISSISDEVERYRDMHGI